jgi:hypothetical protein
MSLKKNISTLALASILGLSLVSPSLSQTATDSDGDGVPDLADADPSYVANPIDTGGAAAPFAIKEALVENNFDYAANKTADDHLELLVKNTGTTPLTGFSIYYAIKDGDTGKTEGSFRKLDGFSVPAGGEARIHFDDGTVAGHFRANPNSIYTTSQAAKTFSVMLKVDGFAPVTVEIAKDKGGAEAAD